jgi:hypothetical protein
MTGSGTLIEIDIPFGRSRKGGQKVPPGDFLLMAWAFVESQIDQAITDEFKLEPDDPRTKIFTDISFFRKVEFLKGTRFLNPGQYQAINRFRKLRNNLFHNSGRPFTSYVVEEAKKVEAIDIADKAVRASIKADMAWRKRNPRPEPPYSKHYYIRL